MYTVGMYIYFTHIYHLILIIITITSHDIIMRKSSNSQASPYEFHPLWLSRPRPEVYRGKATDVRQLPSEAVLDVGDVCGDGNKIYPLAMSNIAIEHDHF